MRSLGSITVLSLKQACGINNHTNPHGIISISTPGDPLPQLGVNFATEAKLYLEFDDMDRDLEGDMLRKWHEKYGRGAKLFNRNHAWVIKNWIDYHLNLEPKYNTDQWDLIIHCTIGQSRSPALAAALSLYYYGNDKEFFDSQKYKPNMHVYRTMVDYLMGPIVLSDS
jgi:predicted protein tyrosine phosphatase